MSDYMGYYNIAINEFCTVENITFSSDFQKKKIFKDLSDRGVITCCFYLNGDGRFNLTPKGYQDAMTIKALADDEIVVSPEGFKNAITISSYKTKESNKKIIDNSVEPCFNVKSIAECYVNLIDRACEHGENNVCMLGIFAPWGRGKSYFFRKVKEYINERTDSKAIQYDIVEFNAWKYQETPGIWAYLFETLYNNKKVWDRNWWSKKKYNIKRNSKSIFRETLLCLSPTLITLLGTLLQKYTTNIDHMLIGTSVASLISIIGLILNFIPKDYNSAISLIKKYSKGISFANELGVQAEIEKEITSLLQFWIKEKETDNKKVILYIDDIDRCSETKMTSIIDSLRTVLENEEIRKRLIIICSIDPEKVIKGIEYKYKTLYDEKEIRSIAIDQMDKIFLTGIALPPLDNYQLSEFVSKLTRVGNISSISKDQLVPTHDKHPPKTNEYIKSDKKNDESIILDDSDIYNQLDNLIMFSKKRLTPRKIRIIYYRVIFANNILCKKENTKITEVFINHIFDLSVGEKFDMGYLSKELCDILNMVVPYKYQEENKVE